MSSRDASIQKHLRGSSLLMAGRLLSMGLNLGVQVLIVRYFHERSIFGAFAYALALGELCASLCVLGLDKALSRFAAVDHDRGERDRVLGSLLGAAMLSLLAGLLLAALVHLFQADLPGLLRADPLAVELLGVLVLLGPLMAADSLLTALFSVVSRPRAIFVRRHLLGPGLKLGAVLTTMALAGDAYTLAVVYVAAVLVGVLSYLGMLRPVLRDSGLLVEGDRLPLRLPSAAFLRYGLFMLASDLVFLFHNGLVVFVLEYYWAGEEVAGFRAVQPFARLNLVVYTTFALLFVPVLSRFVGRGDRRGIQDVIHQTVLWVATLSFPVFAVTYGLSPWLSEHVLGSEYRDTATLLSLLAVGYFVNAVLGIGATTLKVYRHVRVVLAIDLSTLSLAALACWLVVPRWGALGLAAVVLGLLLVHGLACLVAMRVLLGAAPLGRRELPVVVAVLVAAAGLAVVRAIAAGHPLVLVLGVCGSVLLVLAATRRFAGPLDLFPELARVPVLGALLRSSAPAGRGPSGGEQPTP